MSKEKLIPEFRFPEFKDSGEWDVKTLGEVLIKNSKKNKNQKYSQVESVSNKFGFIKQDEYFKNRRVASKDTSNYYVIKKGYFAYNPSRIDVGSLAYKHNDEISIISPLYVSFKANNELINDYFLLSFFNSVTFTKQMIFEGGVRNTLNYDNLIQSKIPIPTIQEQQRIASCLSSLDEVIEAHSKKLELLKDHKKGLMQKLFPQEDEKVPKFRFPEFEKEEAWVKKRFEKVYDFKITNSFSRALLNYEKGEIKNIHYGDIHTKFKTLFDIEIEDVPFINPDVSIENIDEENYCLVGDIVFADASEDINDIGKSIELTNLNNQRLLAGLHTLLARQKQNDLSIGFGGYLFKSDWIRKQIQKEAQGAKVLGISKTRINNISISFPKNKKEQQKIASCLSALDELITAEAEKIEQLQQHKKGLMQGLFPKIEK